MPRCGSEEGIAYQGRQRETHTHLHILSQLQKELHTVERNQNMILLSLITALSFSTILAFRRRLCRTSLWQTISRETPLSTLSSYLSPIAAHLNWALDVSLDHAFFGHSVVRQQPSAVPDLLAHHELRITSSYGSAVTAGGREDEECAICMSKIEAREEIRELRCSHIFHGACFARWLGSNNLGCPLCRGSVAPRRTMSELQ
ncbi:hypothetical protein SAY87_013312 [Trapa incisa]|uniref:RING-type domain-containing protein n=1 Tax=Trapa incisa TaxID=236973 RepID=A0AAN7KEV8_9MYRT|nr:hypothetical protein SAY87_013312 [Trapa incisa]